MENKSNGIAFKTKFNLDEPLFFLHQGKIIECIPHSIKIDIGETHEESYWFKIMKSNNNMDYEFITRKISELFISRQALIDSL